MNNFTPDELNRLNELEAERKKIAAEIRAIKKRASNRANYKPRKNVNTLVFETFGKTCAELTPVEQKQYNAMRQAKTRKQKKKEAQKNENTRY